MAMVWRATRGLAALLGSLALVGNLRAAEIFLRCEGAFQDGRKTTAIFKIDPDANRWADWSESDHRWRDRECNSERKGPGRWDRTFSLCEFPSNKMRHREGTYTSGDGVYMITHINRLTGRWVLERHEEGQNEGRKKYLITEIIAGECAATKDPALGPPPKAKF